MSDEGRYLSCTVVLGQILHQLGTAAEGYTIQFIADAWIRSGACLGIMHLYY